MWVYNFEFILWKWPLLYKQKDKVQTHQLSFENATEVQADHKEIIIVQKKLQINGNQLDEQLLHREYMGVAYLVYCIVKMESN